MVIQSVERTEMFVLHNSSKVFMGSSTKDYKCEIPSSKYQMTFIEYFPTHNFTLFIYIPNFEFKIQNYHCAPNIFKDKFMDFILHEIASINNPRLTLVCPK